jgi:hypothetical protein
MRNLKAKIERLERLAPRASRKAAPLVPSVERVVADLNCLNVWLESRGYQNVEMAVAADECGPTLQTCTLADILKAKRDVARWRQERWPNVTTEAEGEVG